MNPIILKFDETDDELIGKSKWWGDPDLPEDWEYPEMTDENGDTYPLLFLCQIRCADLAKFDTENLLPHEGMLYFFAAVEDYLDDYEFGFSSPFFHNYGEWDNRTFKVLYSPTTDNLSPVGVMWDDEPLNLAADAITFSTDEDEDFYLLGYPDDPEVMEQNPGYINLLQVGEEDRWSLRFVDCGILNFLIKPEDLANRNFDDVIAHLVYC